MLIHKKFKIGSHKLEGLVVKLGRKNLVLLYGSKGYVMCGYLNLSAANKCKDIAVKVTGVATIADVLKAKVFSCSSPAKRVGIHPGQPIKKILRYIA